MELKYCVKCVMPNTKPDLHFDNEGVCDACRSAEKKHHAINWPARQREFERIIAKYRAQKNGHYDCLVPVSGGKDSHYQVYVMKVKYGLNPLCVYFEPTYCSPLGKKNLDNLGQTFGVDVIYCKKNPEVFKKLVIEGFKRVGDNEWPSHLGIFTFPVQVAVNFKIPLIIWGENSQLEYGGPTMSTARFQLDRRWLEEFGGLLGNRIEDMLGVEGITEKDLIPYRYPSETELKKAKILGIFLGYYFKWHGRLQQEQMKNYGFSVREDRPVEGTYTNYENLDEETQELHDYLKFVKYGFSRATDHACTDIRNNLITREEGIELVKKYDGKYPCYGVKRFMEYSGLTRQAIDQVIDRFTNKNLFKCDANGNLLRDIAGNLKLKYELK